MIADKFSSTVGRGAAAAATVRQIENMDFVETDITVRVVDEKTIMRPEIEVATEEAFILVTSRGTNAGYFDRRFILEWTGACLRLSRWWTK